jgi:hypothetical protein
MGESIGPEECMQLVARAGGSPLALEELIRVRAASASVGPGSVADLLVLRIERRAPEERAVLAAGAAIGLEFDEEAIQAAVGRSVQEVAQTLQALVVAELLVAESDGEAARTNRFRHALARDAARAALGSGGVVEPSPDSEGPATITCAGRG